MPRFSLKKETPRYLRSVLMARSSELYERRSGRVVVGQRQRASMSDRAKEGGFRSLRIRVRQLPSEEELKREQEEKEKK